MADKPDFRGMNQFQLRLAGSLSFVPVMSKCSTVDELKAEFMAEVMPTVRSNFFGDIVFHYSQVVCLYGPNKGTPERVFSDY